MAFGTRTLLLRLHPWATAILPSMLAGCAPATGNAHQPASAPPAVAATIVQDAAAGPDHHARELAVDRYHGNWRLVATDDPHAHALMAVGIQSSAGEPQGSGDYVLFQPLCDVVAEQPITGTTDCELIGLAATFDDVHASTQRIALTFHPTADGLPHRLELRAEGERLVGDYVVEGQFRRAVLATRSPAGTP